jgi:hypothetical protein
MGLLWVGTASGQHIQPDTERRYAQKLQVGVAALALLGKQFVYFKCLHSRFPFDTVLYQIRSWYYALRT